MKNCPNCGQAVLPDDTSCWQCSTALESDTPEPTSPRENWAHAATVEADLFGRAADSLAGPLPVHLAITTLLIVVVIWAFGNLSQRPLVQVAFRDRIPSGFTAVTPQNERFTINLPEDWQVYDSSVFEDRAELSQFVIANEEVLTLVAEPLSLQATDLTLKFAAVSEVPTSGLITDSESPMFFFFLESEQLRGLSLEEAQMLAVSDNPEVLVTVNEITMNQAKSHLAITLAIFATERGIRPLRCQQFFAPGAERSGLAISCSAIQASGGRSGVLYRTLTEEVQSSFQYFGTQP